MRLEILKWVRALSEGMFAIVYFGSRMARYYSLRYISLVVVDGHKHCQVHFSDRISKIGIVFGAMRQLKQFILSCLEFFYTNTFCTQVRSFEFSIIIVNIMEFFVG